MIFAVLSLHGSELVAVTSSLKSNPYVGISDLHCLQIPDTCGIDTYITAQNRLKDWMKKGDVAVVVHGARPLDLNPMVRLDCPEVTIAALVLTFPDVRWLFSATSSKDEVKSRPDSACCLLDFRSKYGFQKLSGSLHADLFDGDGLRDWVKGRMVDASSRTHFIPRRSSLALALDEECAYAELHAYSAYRFGYRAKMITTMCDANRLLQRQPIDDPETPELVFEDIFASFADAGTHGISKLYADPLRSSSGVADTFKGRALEWPLLGAASCRIFVTSGRHLPQDGNKRVKNRVLIAMQKASGKHIKTLFKPYAGIYRLWEGAGLHRRLRWTEPKTGKRFRGVAPGFMWPPAHQAHSGENVSHSSPGALLQIADHLTARAEKLWDDLDGSGSVEEAVRGAVLATDALELLGCRTPTQSIEALRLKHKFELLAECQFSGVEHHVCIKERIAEIRRDIKAISYWFGPRKRKMAAWNAEAQILTDLVRILREHGHFDEEQYCMTSVRRAMRKIWLHEKRPWSLLGYPFRWYVEILLDRPVYFVGALTFWTTALFWFFMHHGHQNVSAVGNVSEHGWEASLAETMTTFFQTQTPDGIGWPALLVSSAAILFGFVHLGIFISHLYTQVSRR